MIAAPQRWRLDLAYDGRPFVGWQVQPNGPSIQGALEQAILAVFGEDARVGGSGRTDAGVHAEHQVASFVATTMRSAKAVRDGLNAHLPPEVAVIAATPVPMAFDPRHDVVRKSYRYTWLDRPARCPLRGHRVWHVRQTLDVQAMTVAAATLPGTHDFTAFRAAGCQAAHPVRTIEGARVEREGDLVCFRIVGNGFLRHMVRILAGSLWEVGRGSWEPARFTELLAPLPRDRAGRTAPAQGLTLERVEYAPSEGQ